MEVIPLINISIWLIAKVFVLVALFLYLIFSLVVVKQVSLMTDTLEIGLEATLRLLAYLHLAFAILVFAFAFIVL